MSSKDVVTGRRNNGVASYENPVFDASEKGGASSSSEVVGDAAQRLFLDMSLVNAARDNDSCSSDDSDKAVLNRFANYRGSFDAYDSEDDGVAKRGSGRLKLPANSHNFASSKDEFEQPPMIARRGSKIAWAKTVESKEDALFANAVTESSGSGVVSEFKKYWGVGVSRKKTSTLQSEDGSDL